MTKSLYYGRFKIMEILVQTATDFVTRFEQDHPGHPELPEMKAYLAEGQKRVRQTVTRQRPPQVDMQSVFGCRENQIAHSVDQINEDTKAYVGSLKPGIFTALPEQVTHFYTEYPGVPIRRWTLPIEGVKPEDLKPRLRSGRFHSTGWAEDLIDNPKYITGEPRSVNLVELSVKDLGITGRRTTDRVFNQEALGLYKNPSDVGPHQRLIDTEQPLGSVYYIVMDPMPGRYGGPRVFGLGLDGSGLWLRAAWTSPDDVWDPEDRLVFSLKASEPQKL